jgi:small subunit ribosomal protein S2
MVENTSVKELLEAGVHFGHQTSYWHPRMKKYIFTQRNGIHILDLEKTVLMLNKACDFIRRLAAEGQEVLFVGTKRQAQEVVEAAAQKCGVCYVNQRWLGGLLTNFATIQTRIDYLVRLEDKRNRGELDALSKKEKSQIDKEILRLNKQMGGFKEMTKLPAALFIVDPIKDGIALAEAKKLDIPVVAIADTNCNPDKIDYPIPANDDAIKTIKLISNRIADAIIEGRGTQQNSQLEASGLLSTEQGEEKELDIMTSYSFDPEKA